MGQEKGNVVHPKGIPSGEGLLGSQAGLAQGMGGEVSKWVLPSSEKTSTSPRKTSSMPLPGSFLGV